MTKILLNKQYFAFITFDGMVLEYFSADNDTGRRYHIGMLKSIEIATNNKGVHQLKMNTNRISLSVDLDESVVNAVKAMVDDVQKAMAAL